MDAEQVANFPSFKRGQVAAALWNVYVGHPRVGLLPAAPKPFDRRIGKFLGLGVPFGDDERPGKAGTDLEFSLPSAMELGVALELQNAGLNQLEIARWLIFYRERV